MQDIEFQIGIDTDPSKIVASTTWDNNFSNLFIEDLTGWDDFPEIDRKYYEKISGDGDFVSKFQRIKSREVEVTLAFIDSNDVASLRTKIGNLQLSGDFIRLSVKRNKGLNNTHLEVIEKCYVSGNTLWKRRDNFVRVNMVFKTASPMKDLYVNGTLQSQIL